MSAGNDALARGDSEQFTVSTPTRFEAAPIKGSRFIVDLVPVRTEAECRAALGVVAAEYNDASHHCFAWRLAKPRIERAGDDGEPSGSAGKPILAQLSGRSVVDTAAIVTRYFGGTKLGVGGLVRAYGGSTGQALDAAQLAAWVELTEVAFEHDYAVIDAIDRLLLDVAGVDVERSFHTGVVRRVRLPVDNVSRLSAAIGDLTAGAVTVHEAD